MSGDAEVIEIGAGVAGLSAAIFAARCGHETVVVTGNQVGGQLVTIASVEDYPEFPDGVAGYDLGPMMQEQAERAGAAFTLATVEGLVQSEGAWKVSTSGEELRAPTVIVATGSSPAPLGVPGEERFGGHGVSTCASCDGPLHRGGVVAVVGGGDSALLEALELVHHAAKVLIVT